MPRRQVPCGSPSARGAALVTALVLLAVLSLVGTAAIVTSITDTQIGANYKTAVQAFYAAEAGTVEARARLRATAGAARIVDAAPADPAWRVFLGDEASAQARGYDPGNPLHRRLDRLADVLPGTAYTVAIRHATDASGNVLYWGDDDGDGLFTRNPTTGGNVYVITGYGQAGSARRTVEIEAAHFPGFNVPGALYVEAPTLVQSNVDILGMDSCGTDHKPGVVTTLPASTVLPLGSFIAIRGQPVDIQGDAPATGVAALVAAFRRFATFSYTVSNATHTATTSPGPGDGWGRPTLGATATDPSTCTAYNIVHYDTQGTMVTLSGGVSGCGILLVEGNLQISGAFTWYGLVLVTGSVAFTAGEIEAKQIRGAVLAAGTIPNSIGPNAHLIYCSSAVDTRNLPLRTLHWREL